MIQILAKQGRNIQAIVCNGRQGLLGGFGSVPTQLCLHHMKQIIVRLLTKNPKLEQTKRLKEIAMHTGKVPEDDIQLALEVRHEESKERLSEKNEKKKRKHERARKAYGAIKRKLSYYYTYAKNSDLHIPNNKYPGVHQWTFEI